MSKKMLKNSLIGVGIGFAVSVVLILILNLVSLKINDPDKFLSLFAGVARILGAVVAGVVSARLNGENGLLSGLLAGAFFSVVIFAVAAFLQNDFKFFPSLLQCLACMVASALLGVFGLKKQSSSKEIHKKMMKRIKSS